MKSIRLFILGIAAALCGPTRYTTANTAGANQQPDPAAELAELKKRIAEQETLILQQGEQLATFAKSPLATALTATSEPAAKDSELAQLAKGAGLADLKDVTWRVRAGLTAKQAVDAAVAQIAENQRAEAEATRKKNERR